MNNLITKFNTKIANDLKDELQVKNFLAVPKLSKIVVNIGIKDALADKKNVDNALIILSQITGQKPKITKAKKSIATFKLREGDKIGAMVTLRGKRMYDFYEKLVGIVLPRLRDFRGVSIKSFDGRGNYSLGFSEAIVFPEIDPSKIEKNQGIEITIVTTAKDDKQGLALLKSLGMPFVK
ncbi:MAG: 50S ribosomal protein L5 [Microgenomates group bacterium GW2011_GWA2_37_6]|nr:MAG: 50S ribosomal protein L5 [Microgenomates group bacterium GW2011_GWA2_37_6]